LKTPAGPLKKKSGEEELWKNCQRGGEVSKEGKKLCALSRNTASDLAYFGPPEAEVTWKKRGHSGKSRSTGEVGPRRKGVSCCSTFVKREGFLARGKNNCLKRRNRETGEAEGLW